jgi:type IV pilus assembly protein PilQ
MNKGKALWLLATALMLACAGGPPVAEPTDAQGGPVGLAQIEAIDSVVTADRTRVILRSGSPLVYTSYEPDPTRLVLEIQDAEASLLPERLDVDGDAVGAIEIASKVHKDFAQTRVEFSGLNILDYSLRSEGTNLVLDFLPSPFDPSLAAVPQATPIEAGPETASLVEASPIEEERLPAQDVAASEPVPRPAPAPAPVEPPAPAGHLVGVTPTAVDGGVQVSLAGDGAFRYRTLTLENPDRVVLDLEGVRNDLGNQHLQVSEGAVAQVRIAQFRSDPDPVARVVLDLDAPEPFRVVETEAGLDVVVGERAVAALPSPEPQAVVAQAAPEKAPSADGGPADAARADEPAEAATQPAEAAAQPARIPAYDLGMSQPKGEPIVVDAETAQAPLSLEEMGIDPEDDEFVLFDQAAEFKPATGRGTVPPQFQATTIAGEQPSYTGEKISLHFVEADLKNVFLFFSEFIGLNIVIDPEVSGALTMHLDQVPWDQAFDVILRHQGLEKIVEGNVVRIATTEKLRAEAAQRRALKKAQEDEVDPVTFTKVLSYAKVEDVAPILQQGVRSERGRVVQDERTNTLIITDVPDKREAYQRLLDVLDTRTEQVMIESRIVETDRNFEHNLGINWSVFASADPALGTQTDLDFPNRATLAYDVSLPSAATASTLGLSFGNVLDSFTLDIALEAFENEGKVRILSSPKITTQNNQTAVIEQGTQIPVVTTTAVEINVQYISASLKLQVTPQITAEETVIMDVIVENNSPDFVNRVGDVPPIITEKATTQILVRDGSTAVIGGIFKLSESDAEAGVPGLRKIPVLGWLFKNKAISKQNTELLVFITPKILKSDA